jgi:hypothetical protein
MNAMPSEIELLLAAWERGQRQSSARRALLLLGFACPGATEDRLASAPLGWRNGALLLLRKRWMGDSLEAFGECPACATPLEVQLPVDQLASNTESSFAPRTDRIETGGFNIEFRSPSTRDLIMLESSQGDARTLAAACILRASDSTGEVSPQQLPSEIVEPLAARMLALDPLAEIQVELDCSACGHRWQIALDLPSFLWKEITARARRLLIEVDALARAYGWAEHDIMTMSGFRRRCYLELLGA